MNFRLVKNHPKQPVPDWSFTVDETVLRAPTADKLIAKVVAYRAANGQSAGNPEHEIAVSLIVKYPHLVHEAESPAPLKDPLWEWVNRLWRQPPPKPAGDDTLKARCSVCVVCPHARPIPANKELERRAYLLAQGDLRISTQCAHHRWHNGLAVNLSKAEEWGHPHVPAECWLRAD